MARYTVASLLAGLQNVLTMVYHIEPTIRRFRVGDVAELPTETAYYLEPGTMTVNRINVTSPQLLQTVRFLAERRVDYGDADAALEEMRAFFEGVARDLMRTPDVLLSAFLQSVSTFADAPSGFSVNVVEDGVAAIYGGIELTFSIE